MNYTHVSIGGRLTRDPELRFSQSGKAVCQMSIAVNRKTKNAGGELVDEADFFDAVAYEKTAELIGKHFAKGKAIFVEGRLKLDRWEDKQTGAKRSAVKIIVSGFQFVGGKDDERSQETGARSQNEGDGARQQRAPERGNPQANDNMDEDVPF